MKYRGGLTRVFLVLWVIWVLVVLVGMLPGGTSRPMFEF